MGDDTMSGTIEMTGARMLNLCTDGGKEPTKSNDGCSGWEGLYHSLVSCENANLIDGLETK